MYREQDRHRTRLELNIGLQRQTNREERKIDEWEDYSETDWLRCN